MAPSTYCLNNLALAHFRYTQKNYNKLSSALKYELFRQDHFLLPPMSESLTDQYTYIATTDYQQIDTWLLPRNIKNRAEGQHEYPCVNKVKKLFRFAIFPSYT